jgi:RHS repeat-associated protein
MAYYDIHLMLVNLNIVDLPVGYAPPRGPSVAFRLTYNHRDAFQPAVFSYSNLGPKWTIDWLSYITDNPSNASAAVTLYVQGGGEETYSGYNVGTQSYAPHYDSRAVVVRTSASPIEYELRMPDGSVRVFSQPDGASSFPRKVFMTEWIDPSGNGLTFTYDSSLRLVAVTDAIGQVTTISYELSGDPLKITKVIDPFGRYASFLYNANGRLETITDVMGLQSSFEYNSSDFIRTMTTPYGKTTFEYGQVGRNRWIEATDPLGNAERVEFKDDAPGISSSEPASIIPAGMSTVNAGLNYRNTFYWDKRALSLYRGDYTKARLTHWLHDIDINVTAGVIESTKQPLENRVWYQYPNQSFPSFMGSTAQPIKIGRVLDDGTTQLFQFDYNVAGKVIKEIDPLGRETVYVYGSNNIPDAPPATGSGLDLLQLKQKNDGTYDVLASFTYNSNHQPLTSTDAALQVITMTYSGNGNLSTIVTAPRGSLTQAQRTTTYSYYADTASLGPGRLQTITGPVSGAITDFAYDDHGRLATVTESDGYALATEYDALDRPTKVTYPDSTYEEMIYANLDLARARDRQNRWTHFFYDANRRLVSTRDSLGRIVRQEWCACGALSKLVDASGNVTKWEYDGQNRVVTEKRADNSETLFIYENTTSRLKRRTDALGQHTDYVYFKDNTLHEVSYPNAIEATPAVSFTYGTAYNRIATMVDGIGTTTYSYHAVSTGGTLGATQLASVDGPLPNDTISYTYDELGRSLSRSINSVSASQTYDPLGRVDTVTNALGSFGYSYLNQTNRLAGVTYPNGQTSTYSYYGNSADRRLQQIHHQTAGLGTISKFDYAYDIVGNITTWTQQRDGGSSAVVRAYDFGYDSADQLTAATYRTTDATPAILKSYVYTYDSGGNRKAEQIDDEVRQANYNTVNHLTSQGPGGSLLFAGTLSEQSAVTIAGRPATVAADNTFSGKAVVPSGTSAVDIVAKDYSGNQRTSTYSVTQSASARSFSYDANGNTTDDGTRIYEWDAENRLLAIEQGTHRSEFTYDGQNRRVRIVEKENGSTASDAFYLWCGLEICEERDSTGSSTTKRFFPQGEEQVDTAYFYTRDHLGSIRELIDSGGNLESRYDYDPFGRSTKLSGGADPAFGYTGQYQHANSGKLLSLYRAYDPDIGRWLSEDPIGIDGGINLYAYVEAQPINAIDPLGLSLLSAAKSFTIGFVLGAAATVAVGALVASSPVWGSVAAVAIGAYASYQTAVTLTEIVTGVSQETGNPLSVEDRVDLGAGLAGAIAGAGVAGRGKEIPIGRNLRIALFGNRAGNPYGELPHYHVRKSGKPTYSQGWKRHRPWEPKPGDRTWCDRIWPPGKWPRK